MPKQSPIIKVIDGPGSWRSQALHAVLRFMTRSALTFSTDVSALRRRYEEIDARHFPCADWVRREPVQCDGVVGEWVRVPETREERVVLYLHGGSFAYRFPNTHASFAARLCRQLGARALIPNYRLAPEHPFPAAPDDCYAAYQWLMQEGVNPCNIVLVGDSAGGTLSLVTLYRVRNASQPLPACAVLLSPGVDCTMTSASFVENVDRDPLLKLSNLLVLRQHYVPQPEMLTHPEVSPLFGDFTGYPPLLIQAGTTELLRDEAIRAAQKARDAGVEVQLELWSDTPHSFQIVSFLPEAAQAVDHIVRFVNARTGWTLPA